MNLNIKFVKSLRSLLAVTDAVKGGQGNGEGVEENVNKGHEDMEVGKSCPTCSWDDEILNGLVTIKAKPTNRRWRGCQLK